MDENLIVDFLNKTNVFAVIGVSRDPEKYGHQVYRDLRNAGYKIYCVNPNTDRVLGDKCYASLEALPTKPDVVDVVVPPKITEQVVKTCEKLGTKKVWMQHGSEFEEDIDFCTRSGITVVHGVCVMIERKNRSK
ncbi:MAG: CoA-binding protein [Candidatus Bathyarchaeia archaeon]